MTEPLSIKDLNCGNCPNDRSCSVHPTWPIEGLPQAEQREIITIRDYTSKCGCLRHPSALQVLAGPVIAALNLQESEYTIRLCNTDNDNLKSEFAGRAKGYADAINLLKGDD